MQADVALRRRVSDALTTNEGFLLAQALSYAVSVSNSLRLSGPFGSCVWVMRIDHPGDYPVRYV